MVVVTKRESRRTNEVAIRVNGVHKAFGEHQVLRGVDLEINRGGLVAVVGGSGCGKTVLLQHLIGHHRPDQGRIYLADYDLPDAGLVDITELDEQEMDKLRAHAAVVFQRNALFSASVYENIALSLREVEHLDEAAIGLRVREALDAVGFAGDQSLEHKQRDELSGGMAKRVAVARAIAIRPMLIYYDEPTTGLDPVSAARIQDLIAEMHARGTDDGPRTSLIVTHDKDLLVRLRPRVVMLHEGRVHFDGSFPEFAASEDAVIRPYFEVMPTLHERELAP